MRRKNLEARDRRIHRALGRVCRQRRELLDLTKAEVAAKAKLDKSQYGKLEKGGGTSAPGYVDVARALGWTAAELYAAAFPSDDDPPAAHAGA